MILNQLKKPQIKQYTFHKHNTTSWTLQVVRIFLFRQNSPHLQRLMHMLEHGKNPKRQVC